jgi:hypothetical protein
MTRPLEEVRRVLELASADVAPGEIARRTGIPRRTIYRWMRGGCPTRTQAKACMRCTPERFWVFRGLVDSAYAYLLGLYLGDGCLAVHPRGVFRLEITLDGGYPRIIGECEAAVSLVMPFNRVSVRSRADERAVDVAAYSQHWTCLFPQHGPGHKHHRAVQLVDWQRAIADHYPHRFLRGLIHSDGCRATNTVKHAKKAYSYPRYQFSNRSADIRGIFCEYCDKLGIEWRQMNRYNVSVARAESVAKLDRFIGPKQ